MLRHGSLLMSREKLHWAGMKLVIWRRGWNSPELGLITRLIPFYERMQLLIGKSMFQTGVLVNSVDCITSDTRKSSMARLALRSTVTGPSRPVRVRKTKQQLIASSSGTLAFGRILFYMVRIESNEFRTCASTWVVPLVVIFAVSLYFFIRRICGFLTPETWWTLSKLVFRRLSRGNQNTSAAQNAWYRFPQVAPTNVDGWRNQLYTRHVWFCRVELVHNTHCRTSRMSC